ALRRGQRLPRVSLALADAARALLPIAELGNVDLRQRYGHQVLPFLADHFAAADVLAKVAFHLAADDFAEALLIALDFLTHCRSRFRLHCRPVFKTGPRHSPVTPPCPMLPDPILANCGP